MYVYNLVRNLRNADHDVSVVTSDLPNVGPSVIDGVKIHRLPVLFDFYGAPFCPSLFLCCREKRDIIHAHMPPRFFADYVAILHRLRFFSATPLILSLHLYLENAPPIIKALSSFHYKTVGRFIFNNSNKIIVPTKTYRTLLIERLGVCSEKIEVIPYGLDLNLFDPENFNRDEIKKKYSIASRKIVLFVGRLDKQGAEQKGIRYLLSAIPLVTKEIRDVEFIIVGEGEMLAYYREISRKRGMTHHAKFIGGFPHGRIPSLYSIADAFVLPSLNESFGISLCEAMAMGKPVVATRIGGIVDVVEDGKTGFLVEPKNPKELARAILKILSDENLANRIGKEGRKLVEKKYNWNLVLRETLRVYEEARAQI